MNVFKPQDRPLAVRSKGQLLSQPMMWEKRPEDPSVSNPMVVDLTADSSREGSSGSSQQLQVVNESMAVEKRPKLQDYLPPVTFANTTITSQQPNMDSATLSPPAAQNTGSGLADPRTEFLSSDRVSPEGFAPQSQNAHSEPHSSYPSLSLPAQPVVDDSEAVRTSLRSKKKPTKFFGDPLRHSVKRVEEEVQDLPSGNALPISPSPRKPLIRDRPQIDLMEVSSSSFVKVNKNLDGD